MCIYFLIFFKQESVTLSRLLSSCLASDLFLSHALPKCYHPSCDAGTGPSPEPAPCSVDSQLLKLQVKRTSHLPEIFHYYNRKWTKICSEGKMSKSQE